MQKGIRHTENTHQSGRCKAYITSYYIKRHTENTHQSGRCKAYITSYYIKCQWIKHSSKTDLGRRKEFLMI